MIYSSNYVLDIHFHISISQNTNLCKMDDCIYVHVYISHFNVHQINILPLQYKLILENYLVARQRGHWSP